MQNNTNTYMYMHLYYNTLPSIHPPLPTGRTVDITAGEAVATGLINNETLGYFIARTQLWLTKIGKYRVLVYSCTFV